MILAAATEPTFGNIDNSIIVAFLGMVGVVLAAFIAQKYTTRNARKAYELQEKAQRAQEEVEERKTLLEQAKQWRDDTIELRKQRDEDRKRYDDRMAAMESKISALTGKVEDLTDLRRDDATYIIQLTTWCKVVVVLLRQHGIPHPPVPPGITDSNPRGIPEQRGGSTAAAGIA